MNKQQSSISTVKIAVIILAAGSSSRLGKPKQLLQFQNQTLINGAVKTALAIRPEAVIVVSGFLHQELVTELETLPVIISHNKNWPEGMGSSIEEGMKAVNQLESLGEIEAVLFLLSDQPLITEEHLQKLITQFYIDKRSTIIATGYARTQGVPAIFDKSLFPVLQNLPGNKGAQWLFKTYSEQVSVVPFEGAAIDIDTQEDYDKLLKLSEKKYD